MRSSSSPCVSGSKRGGYPWSDASSSLMKGTTLQSSSRGEGISYLSESYLPSIWYRVDSLCFGRISAREWLGWFSKGVCSKLKPIRSTKSSESRLECVGNGLRNGESSLYLRKGESKRFYSNAELLFILLNYDMQC
jgi:hypothetical protein